MQTFILTCLSDAELDKLDTRIHEIRQVPFEDVDHILQEEDETYPFTMPGWLTIIISI